MGEEIEGDYEEEGEEEEGEEEEEDEEEEEEERVLEKIVVVKNSPSNYSAMSYEMFVEEGRTDELQDDNKELTSLTGSLAPSNNSRSPRHDEADRASLHTNNSSVGPRKVSPQAGPERVTNFDLQTNLEIHQLTVPKFVSCRLKWLCSCCSLEVWRGHMQN